jgi:putative ABC transport system substrate-binding protein
VVGENVEVVYRSSDGDAERLPALAAELVGLPVDVLVTYGGTPAALAAKHATDSIPIVVLLVGDPIGAGLVNSYQRPGGNVTGITNVAPETSAKRLELLRDVVPGLARVDYLWNPANTVSLLDWGETQAAARVLSLQVRSVEARDVDEIPGALSAIVAERPDAVIVNGEIIFVQQRPQVVGLLANSRLPTMYSARQDVTQGGLMAYGVSSVDVYRRAAGYVDKILKGA